MAEPTRELTQEQQALAQARKEKKLGRQQQNSLVVTPDTLDPRSWLTIPVPNTPSRQLKLLSWNLLAQCLIRRELFPTSDCLKAGQREPMIHEELLRQDADILCLQEVDRLEKLLPMLEKAGYLHHYASGPRKKHGCLIAYKKDLYTLASHRTIFYDEQVVQSENKGSCKGNTFMTRNIASLVALKRKDDEKQGFIVATTHLFWHPRYTYERIRQLGIMFREALAFRDEQNATQWSCILAGDFNFTPSDPAYSLLFGDPLLQPQSEAILASRVIHASVDPTVLMNAMVKTKDEEESEESDPDRVITNARQSKPEDGLLSVAELISWFQNLPKPRSAYNAGLYEARKAESLPTYGERTQLSAERHGFNEPEYTSYTHYWKSVLDYIFFLDPVDEHAGISGLLKPPTVDELDPGIPKRRVSGSDHTVLVAEFAW